MAIAVRPKADGVVCRPVEEIAAVLVAAVVLGSIVLVRAVATRAGGTATVYQVVHVAGIMVARHRVEFADGDIGSVRRLICIDVVERSNRKRITSLRHVAATESCFQVQMIWSRLGRVADGADIVCTVMINRDSFVVVPVVGPAISWGRTCGACHYGRIGAARAYCA